MRAVITLWMLAALGFSALGCKRAPECAPCVKDSDCAGFLLCKPVVTAGMPEGNVCKPRDEKRKPGAALPDPICEADCRNDCRVLGKCTLRGDECFIEKDADCKNAEVCKDYGMCTFEYTPQESFCTAKTPADCAGSRTCREQGRCIPAEKGTGLRGCIAPLDAGAR